MAQRAREHRGLERLRRARQAGERLRHRDGWDPIGLQAGQHLRGVPRIDPHALDVEAVDVDQVADAVLDEIMVNDIALAEREDTVARPDVERHAIPAHALGEVVLGEPGVNQHVVAAVVRRGRGPPARSSPS